MTTLDFAGAYSLAASLGVAAVLAGLCWWFYYAHLRDVSPLLRWVLPTLRALAIVMCLVMLASPTIRHRSWNGIPNHVSILLDGTQSMQWHDAGSASAEGHLSRLQRAARLLLMDEPRLLSTLSERSEITVNRFGGAALVPLWSSTRSESQPLPPDERAWLPTDWPTPTAIGDVLAEQVHSTEQLTTTANSDASRAPDEADAGSDCVVLLTDGRSNSGSSPLEAARQLTTAKRKLFVVGYGNAEEPYDLAITSIRMPDRVLKTDLLRGEIVWKDQFPVGQPLQLRIRVGDKVLWEQTVISKRCQRRSVSFAIPVSTIPISADDAPHGAEVHEQTVALRATIEAIGLDTQDSSAASLPVPPTEVHDSNNDRTMHLRVVDRRYQILIVDGRARWETRYLRNALERDPNWQVDAFVVDPTAGPRPFSESTTSATLPQSLEDLLKYDLVVIGELPFGALSVEWMNNLQRFVSDSGGGLIVVDGPHGLLRDAAWRPLHALLPVQWISAQTGQLSKPISLQLAPAGESVEALRLDVGTASEQSELWRNLPGIQFVAPVQALPGAETLLQLSNESASPVLVTQRFGAGRVLYLATDQTWRWRYGVADRYHQRWWNQLARWAMRMPFAVQNEYLQLTTDHSQYTLGDSVVVTARLRDQQGKGVSSGDVQVHCRSQAAGESTTRSVSMQADESIVGLYRAQIESLPIGEYAISLTAAGIPDQSLELTCPISVAGPSNPELQELSCSAALLRELAETTGGAYLPEASGDHLCDLLTALSNAHAVETRTALAESYFWFIPLVLLLALEWWLRKRSGLL